MSNIYHLAAFQMLRTAARKSGILKYIKRGLASRQRSYEEAFHEALRAAVRGGDTVWDVGANVGVYTKLFLEWAGEHGAVVAFEPLPKAVAALKTVVGGEPLPGNFVVVEAALASEAGTATFAGNLDGEGVTTTGHLADPSEAVTGSITVEVTTADEVMTGDRAPRPTVVKIDVEGFEEDVLQGGGQVFGSETCREILIEMHFTRMAERGLGNSAARIVKMLKGWGYNVRWVDPSHLHAKRR